MNRQLRRLGVGLIVCYIALFVMLNYIQVCARATRSTTNPLNSREVVRDFDRPRGQIISADGAVLAQSVPSAPGDPFTVPAQYPEGDLFGHVTGYLNFNFGATGVEQQYNDELSGQTVSTSRTRRSRDLFVDRDHIGDVHPHRPQRPAAGGTRPRSATRRARSSRSTRATGRSSRCGASRRTTRTCWRRTTATATQAAKKLLEADPDQPLRGRTYQERFFPGSTFKVVTGSTGARDRHGHRRQPRLPAGDARTSPPRRRADLELRRRGVRRHAVRDPASVVQLGVRADGRRVIGQHDDGSRRARRSGSTTRRRSTCPAAAAVDLPGHDGNSKAVPRPGLDRPVRRRRRRRSRWRWSPPASPTAASSCRRT